MELIFRPAAGETPAADPPKLVRVLSVSSRKDLSYAWEMVASRQADVRQLAGQGPQQWERNPLSKVVSITKAQSLESSRCKLARKLDEELYIELCGQAEGLASRLWEASKHIRTSYGDLNLLKLHMLWSLGQQVDIVQSDLEGLRTQQDAGSQFFLKNRYFALLPEDDEDRFFYQLLAGAAAQEDYCAVHVALSMPLLEEAMVGLYKRNDEEGKRKIQEVETKWQGSYKQKLELFKEAAAVVQDNRVNLSAQVVGVSGSADINVASVERELINWYGIKVIKDLFEHYNVRPAIRTTLGLDILNPDTIRRRPTLVFVHNSRLNSVETYQIQNDRKVGFICKRECTLGVSYNKLQEVGHRGVYVASYKVSDGRLMVRNAVGSEPGSGFTLPRLKKSLLKRTYVETASDADFRTVEPRTTQVSGNMSAALRKIGVVGGCWRLVTEGLEPLRDAIHQVPSNAEAWDDGFREVDGPTVVAALGGWFRHEECEKAAWWGKVDVPGRGPLAFGHCASQNYDGVRGAPGEAYRVTVFAAEGGLIWKTNFLLGGGVEAGPRGS